jgi:MATE family multidrug resistance protein
MHYIIHFASVRVSNELGKGDAEAAKFAVKVISSISVCLGVVFWILCLVFGHKIGYLFTSDEEVIEVISDLSLLLSLSVLLNSIQPVLSGMYLISQYHDDSERNILPSSLQV